MDNTKDSSDTFICHNSRICHFDGKLKQCFIRTETNNYRQIPLILPVII